MKKTILILVLVLALLTSSVFAATPAETNTADALNHLGLFLGTGKGYELDNGLTRAQGITLLVRMIGKEEEANANTYENPLTDVPAWAAGYIGYAYENAITNGISETQFGSDQPMTDYMFLTLTLRALGYSDSGEDPLYTWNDPYEVACELGLIASATADGAFTRGDAVSVFWNALSVKLNGEKDTLADRLVAQGIFSADDLDEAKEIREDTVWDEDLDGFDVLTPSNEDTTKDSKSEVVPVPNPGIGETDNNTTEPDWEEDVF